MIQTIPEVREVHYSGSSTVLFDEFELKNQNPRIPDAEELLSLRMWNLPSGEGGRKLPLEIHPLGEEKERLLHLQGYEMEIREDSICIKCDTSEGYVYALSTLKQILIRSDEGFRCETLKIRDWPVIEHRSMSTTFAWYAGYGRIGFDMQLWDFDKWKEFLNICADYKINQLNMCLYGYWPYEVEGYPESVYRDIKMKIWNPESEQWLEMSFTHPNLRHEFLKELIAYGHRLGIRFFSYMGLNSYSGGYANAHPEKRMKFPENNTFINDFDSLCLSDPTTIDYLKACMKAVVDQGFDGIDFEESEEAYWYCNCEGCKAKFWKGNSTAEETLHAANTWLLDILYKELKRLKPDIVIGIRGWRQPPLVRSEQLLQSMKDSIPEDVVLFWAPGQYVADEEFDKWIRYFGKERIRARDTEAIGFAACFGRLIHPFRWNGLRAEEEPITQFIEEDIRQHRGSVKRQVAGINGYLFEWYGFFMAFFAHAWYGWGSDEEPESFYQKATQTVFGELSEDILYVMKHMLTLHECQINIFELKFPMAENKVSE